MDNILEKDNGSAQEVGNILEKNSGYYLIFLYYLTEQSLDMIGILNDHFNAAKVFDDDNVRGHESGGDVGGN